MKVQRGDRVRLDTNLAERLMKDQDANGGPKANWLVRRGVVIRVSKPANNVVVKWDDRVTMDTWPTRALKKAP
jgi:hypothetical protein